ncbi:MAG: hypothetical protein WBE08_13045 [Methyloceanibacter sp.]|jgi:hypothetical protein
MVSSHLLADSRHTRHSNVIERMFCTLKKNGDASQPYMITTPKTTSQDSHSPPSSVSEFE